MIEFVFTFVGEILLQLVVELLVELGLHSRKRPRRRTNVLLATFGYICLGALLGGLSLLVLPQLLVPESWRIANLLLAPVLAGLAMAWLGRVREKRGGERLRIDRFAHGYLFALAFALVRFAFAG